MGLAPSSTQVSRHVDLQRDLIAASTAELAQQWLSILLSNIGFTRALAFEVQNMK